MKDFNELKDYMGEDRVLDSFEIKKELEEAESSIKTFDTGFSRLDKEMQGFAPGELIALSGPPKNGKTLLAQTLTYKMNEQECFPLWIQFENTPQQFFKQFEDAGLPYFFTPKKLKMHSLDWVEERICESIAKFGAGCVFIDHLHYLFDIYKSRNSSLEIGQIIRSLKLMAVEYNIFIVILLHMTKVPPGDEPSSHHFRDSGLIRGETDTGLIIWRDPKDPTRATLKLDYSRRTGALWHKISLKKIDGLLKEVTDDYNASDNGNGSSEGVGTWSAQGVLVK